MPSPRGCGRGDLHACSARPAWTLHGMSHAPTAVPPCVWPLRRCCVCLVPSLQVERILERVRANPGFLQEAQVGLGQGRALQAPGPISAPLTATLPLLLLSVCRARPAAPFPAAEQAARGLQRRALRTCAAILLAPSPAASLSASARARGGPAPALPPPTHSLTPSHPTPLLHRPCFPCRPPWPCLSGRAARQMPTWTDAWRSCAASAASGCAGAWHPSVRGLPCAQKLHCRRAVDAEQQSQGCVSLAALSCRVLLCRLHRPRVQGVFDIIDAKRRQMLWDMAGECHARS